jgi:hypothetical protein
MWVIFAILSPRTLDFASEALVCPKSEASTTNILQCYSIISPFFGAADELESEFGVLSLFA